jgi:hypothetical protein
MPLPDDSTLLEQPMSSTTHLLELPDEILVEILNQMSSVPRQKRMGLLRATLICRKLNALAMEVLLSHPVVHIYNTRGLLCAYLKRPELAARAQNLEILTQFRKGFKSRPTGSLEVPETYAARSDSKSRDACATIVHQSNLSTESKKQCMQDLEQESCNTFLAVLIILLPSINAFYPGTGPTLHFRHQEQSYIRDAFATIASNLKILELSIRWDDYR